MYLILRIITITFLIFFIANENNGLKCFKCEGRFGSEKKMCKKLIACPPKDYCFTSTIGGGYMKGCDGLTNEDTCNQNHRSARLGGTTYACTCNDVDGCNAVAPKMDQCTSCKRNMVSHNLTEED